MDSIKVGFAMCGSFCTFSKAIESIENLINNIKDYKKYKRQHNKDELYLADLLK